ncbi:uncharacterized protein [Prorops nasuta]|uniref:uncharacterized protein n=1 Tax=Prorops nasuta TaxID=863751 RepID=UPI0034CD7151
MVRRLLVTLTLLTIFTAANCQLLNDKKVSELIRDWAPLVWLAPGERFLPLGVPEFLENMQADESYLRTRVDLELLLHNKSSFLYGKEPADSVPVYAFVRNCVDSLETLKLTKLKRIVRGIVERRDSSKIAASGHQLDAATLSMIQTNAVSMKELNLALNFQSKRTDDFEEERKRRKKEKEERKNRFRKLHFHVTYWMFYPFSEGKAVCVLNLGFLGSWPIPTLGGRCLGKLREYGNHVGDWEHVSLYFDGKDYPLAMYVSAHDAGAYYIYDARRGHFAYASQETRKGIFQKPIFPERVFTDAGSHPVLFSARGSHGLWTAPGKHRFVRLPRLYDESGFGAPWPTWRKLEFLSGKDKESLPAWMTFRGKWGNPKSNCHPLAHLGFDICEFVDGPTGIPMKKSNFKC